jgi:hypothetical protein
MTMSTRVFSAPRTVLSGAMLVLAGLTAATPASAQLAGLYVGQTDQGQTIEITITQDSGGLYYFGGALVFWEATCKVSGPGRQVGWGIGTTVPLTFPNTEYTFASNALYENYKFRFLGGTRIKGTFLGRTPEFVDPNMSSKQVQLCDSGSRSFVADWVPPSEATARRALPAPGQAVQVR